MDDVREIAGVRGLFFRKNATPQKIKHKSSVRFVPLAQPVLDAGFLNFVEDMKATGHPRMFPHLPTGTNKKAIKEVSERLFLSNFEACRYTVRASDAHT